MFLLRSSDRSELYLTDQFQKAEEAFRKSEMCRAEYEERMQVLQSLRDHGCPQKPKRMHWRTYKQLKARDEELANRWCLSATDWHERQRRRS
jgi:hypothetical protein